MFVIYLLSDLPFDHFCSICACVQLLDLKMTVDGLEKERDFYFGKLRDIEIICQESDNINGPVLSKIMDVLYATEVNKNYTHINSGQT